MVATEAAPPMKEALAEFEELLRGAAASDSSRRSDSVRYLACRSALLASEVAHLLPGFVSQCSSLSLFQSFIRLYDPRKEVRAAFLQEALAPSRRRLAPPLTRSRRPLAAFEMGEA